MSILTVLLAASVGACIMMVLSVLFGGNTKESDGFTASDDDSISGSSLVDSSSTSLSDDDSFSSSSRSMHDDYSDSMPSINPANGLPMMGSFDIEGNAYGTDSHSHFDDWSISSIVDDSLSSSCFDDTFSSCSSSSFDSWD